MSCHVKYLLVALGLRSAMSSASGEWDVVMFMNGHYWHHLLESQTYSAPAEVALFQVVVNLRMPRAYYYKGLARSQ